MTNLGGTGVSEFTDSVEQENSVEANTLKVEGNVTYFATLTEAVESTNEEVIRDGGKIRIGDRADALFNVVTLASLGGGTLNGFNEANSSGFPTLALELTLTEALYLEMFGVQVGIDSAPAMQAAADYCAANNVKVIRAKGLTYTLSSATTTFTFPHDDGTVYPPWLGSGDVNLSPESVVTMPVAVHWPSNLELKGEGTTIEGVWDGTTVNTNEIIGIMYTESDADLKVQYTQRSNFSGIRFSNMLLPMVIQGICLRSSFELEFYNCGFSIIAMGNDLGFNLKDVECFATYAGPIIGGWWTQRNRTANTTQLPPYPALDIQLVGWSDVLKAESLFWFYGGIKYDATAAAIDAFFDTYFFKSANSPLQSSGGRASNNLNGGVVISTYRGVTGRALSMFSRYGRTMICPVIDNIKTFGCWRSAIHYNGIVTAGKLVTYYIEVPGLVDPSLGNVAGNLLGDVTPDPYYGGSIIPGAVASRDIGGTFPSKSQENIGCGFLVAAASGIYDFYAATWRDIFIQLNGASLSDTGNDDDGYFNRVRADSGGEIIRENASFSSIFITQDMQTRLTANNRRERMEFITIPGTDPYIPSIGNESAGTKVLTLDSPASSTPFMDGLTGNVLSGQRMTLVLIQGVNASVNFEFTGLWKHATITGSATVGDRKTIVFYYDANATGWFAESETDWYS